MADSDVSSNELTKNDTSVESKNAKLENALSSNNMSDSSIADNDMANRSKTGKATFERTVSDSETSVIDMTGIDNRADFLESYFEYMQYKWNGALTYGNLDKEKKWKVLINENGYILEMRTFAGYHDLIILTDELKDSLRELAKMEVGVEKKIGTEEFRYSQK